MVSAIQKRIKKDVEKGLEKEKKAAKEKSHQLLFREVCGYFNTRLRIGGLNQATFDPDYRNQVWRMAAGTCLENLDVHPSGPKNGGFWDLKEFFLPVAESRVYNTFLERRGKENHLKLLFKVAGTSFQKNRAPWLVVTLDDGSSPPGAPRIMAYRRDDSTGICTLPVDRYIAENTTEE